VVRGWVVRDVQSSGAKWVKRVAPGGLSDGKLHPGQQVVVANGIPITALSHRDSVMILRDKLFITLIVCDWQSRGENSTIYLHSCRRDVTSPRSPQTGHHRTRPFSHVPHSHTICPDNRPVQLVSAPLSPWAIP
jgi:hypothetical protein